MHKLVKHFVIAALFAVAILGGSGLPVLQAGDGAHAHSVHAHDHDVAGHVHEDGLADAGHTHDHPSDNGSSDRCCGHVHVHCCAATAILSAGAATLAVADGGTLRVERNAALPYGQLANPPLRPPRAAA